MHGDWGEKIPAEKIPAEADYIVVPPQRAYEPGKLQTKSA